MRGEGGRRGWRGGAASRGEWREGAMGWFAGVGSQREWEERPGGRGSTGLGAAARER
jgi:hypothetical protein